MAEIALRDYLTEIDTLIEGNSYDEAIAHCRHILGAYPKCLEVYRLLGKATLEKEDDNAAIDLFQRVLSADPEDFVARVGLSIVYDRQGRLDDALWQMERGFELMPSNDVIQSELRRLYGRRDGVEPDRIALTRGALARMYAQGDLYDEAIAELRALLKESPDRVDLQVLLAETLWRNEQRNEAAAIAERILDKHPYCLPAGLILGEIWLNSGFAEDGEILLRRAQAIDPDNLRAVSLLGSVSPINEQRATVSRLEFHTQFAPATPEVEAAMDEVPDWLAGLAGLTTLDQPESAGVPGLPPPAPAPAIELGPSAEAELPSWMEGFEQAAPTPAPEAATEMPDWLSALSSAPEAPPVEAAAEPTGPAPAQKTTDWLSQLRQAAEEPPAPTTEPEGLELEAGEPGTDWLSQIAEPGEATAPPAEEPLPDWLTSEAEKPTQEQAELPDWLSDLGAPPSPAAPTDLSTHDLAQSEVPDWLQAMRPPQTEFDKPAIELPEVEEAEVPEWMSSIEPGPPADAALDFLQRLGETAQVEPVEPEMLEPAPPPEPEVEVPAPDAGMPSPDEALAFFARLTAGKEDELRKQAEQAAETRMADITGRKPPAPAEPARPIEQPAPPATPPAAEPPAPSAPTELSAMPTPDEALAFLQSLTIGKEDQLREAAEREAEERMEVIMGGKPGTSPLRPKSKPLTPPEPEPIVPPTDELLSPDAALAFLESLTVGKEEQLREAAEREAEERMEVIMGGKPGTSPLRPKSKPLTPPEPEEPAAPAAEPVDMAAPAPESTAAEDALAYLEDLTAPPEPGPVEAPPSMIEVYPEAAPIAATLTEEPLLAESPIAIGFWLQTADDEDSEPIPPDYFERAAKPQPPPSAKVERATRRPAVAPQARPEPVAVPVAPIVPPIGAEEFQARLSADPADHEARLGLARVWWSAGDQPRSLQMYQQLIEEDMFLSEVAGDLQRNLETFEHADWFKALGDANMKLGRLAPALDAYRQALTHL